MTRLYARRGPLAMLVSLLILWAAASEPVTLPGPVQLDEPPRIE